MVFSSCRGPEYSHEVESKQHGAFTLALLEGIGEGKAAAGRPDGNIRPARLLAWLWDRVPELTKNMQTPICPLHGDFGEPFPLARVK